MAGKSSHSNNRKALSTPYPPQCLPLCLMAATSHCKHLPFRVQYRDAFSSRNKTFSLNSKGNKGIYLGFCNIWYKFATKTVHSSMLPSRDGASLVCKPCRNALASCYHCSFHMWQVELHHNAGVSLLQFWTLDSSKGNVSWKLVNIQVEKNSLKKNFTND